MKCTLLQDNDKLTPTALRVFDGYANVSCAYGSGCNPDAPAAVHNFINQTEIILLFRLFV